MTDCKKEYKGVFESFSQKHPWLTLSIFIIPGGILSIILDSCNVFKSEDLNIAAGVGGCLILVIIIFGVLEVLNNLKHGRGVKQAMFGDGNPKQKASAKSPNQHLDAFSKYPSRWATLTSSNVYLGLEGCPYRLINLIDEYVELKKVWNSSWSRYDILAVTESGMPVCWLKAEDAEVMLPILDNMKYVRVEDVYTDKEGCDMSVVLNFRFGETAVDTRDKELPENYDDKYLENDDYDSLDEHAAEMEYDGTYWEDRAEEERELEKEMNARRCGCDDALAFGAGFGAGYSVMDSIIDGTN